MHARALPALLIASSLLVTATARIVVAKPKPNYKGLTDQGRVVLQSFYSSMKDCRPDAPPHVGANDIVASSGLDNCARVIKTQRKRLARIKGGDRNHPVFVEFSRYLAKLEKAHKRWVAEYAETRKKAAGLQRRAIAMKKDLARQSGTLWFLSDADGGKPRLGERNIHPAAVKKNLEAVDGLEALATACAGDYAAVLADKKLARWAVADRTPSPKASCDLATRRAAIATAWLPKAIAAHAEFKRKQFQGFVNDIATKGRTSEHILELLTRDAMAERVTKTTAEFTALASPRGVALADDAFASWLAVADQRAATIKAAAKVRRERRRAKNSRVTKAVKKMLRGSKLRVKKIGFSSKQGRIIKNGVGIPLRKAWSGDLLVKKKGESFCRLYPVDASASYKGGGRYQAPVARGLVRRFQIAACK